jgi:hypothetical protein
MGGFRIERHVQICETVRGRNKNGIDEANELRAEVYYVGYIIVRSQRGLFDR